MNRITGAGVTAPAPPPPIHDEQYDVDVYPAKITDAVMDILVPAHGKLNLTMACVNALYGCTGNPFHLIILDDAPPDDYGLTEHWVKTLQRERNNVTYCLSRIPYKCGNTFFNVGLRYCKTDYVATVMNSMVVEPSWDTVALQLMKQDPQIGTVGFKCLFPWGRIESAGIALHGHVPIDIGRDLPGWYLNDVREAQAVQWAMALHRRKAVEGNLEENLFNGHVGWDDIDNCFVVRSKGWKIMYCGQGVGIHTPRATRGSNSEEAHVKNQQNARTFFKRWGLWNMYLESTKMDVGSILKYETKAKLSRTVTQIQVLQKLLRESEVMVQAEVNEAMQELKVDPQQYLLEMNPQKNTWELKTNPKAVQAQTEAAPVEATIKPASDTETQVIDAVAEEVKAA